MGHAGKVAAALRSACDLSAVGSQKLLHKPEEGERPEGRAERDKIGQRDPASAVLALLQAMRDHADSCCGHGCIVHAKQLCKLYCRVEASEVVQCCRLERQTDCPVALSLNEELRVYARRIKHVRA